MKKRTHHKSHQIKGILSKSAKGFGFVRPENKEITDGRDIFIAPNDMKDAMNGDLVAVMLLQGHRDGMNRQGKISKVLERATREFVGTYFEFGNRRFVRPETKREGEEALVGRKESGGARTGDKVMLRVTKWPNAPYSAEGRVEEIISRKGEPGGDVKALIRSYQVEEAFPEPVLRAAERVANEVTAEELMNRRDLRQKTIFTIDGADARDFDDAVSIEALADGGFSLGVHIADVAHYVTEGSPFDREAFFRGTSVYLPDRVIPMLPFSLSNGICSLKPFVDRLTLTVQMVIDANGRVTEHEVFESVICSCARLVYEDVSDLLEYEDPVQKEKLGHIATDLQQMQRLAERLRAKRMKLGSLDFDIREAKIKLGEDGIPIEIAAAERRSSNRMIEEFMLLANQVIAEHVQKQSLPFVYRVHETPDADKLEEFLRFLRGLGMEVAPSKQDNPGRQLHEILEQSQGTQAETIIHTILLRTMKKARYDTECLGHFGLGVDYYCHFTSPIRRYPDLMIHRVIKESLHASIEGEREVVLRKKTADAAEHSSRTERRAEELEREVEKLKKAQYMESFLGEQFVGTISGIGQAGFYVQLANTIEGMVRLDSLTDDSYQYEPEKYRMIGRRHRKVYGIGKEVTVLVKSVNVIGREIDFILV